MRWASRREFKSAARRKRDSRSQSSRLTSVRARKVLDLRPPTREALVSGRRAAASPDCTESKGILPLRFTGLGNCRCATNSSFLSDRGDVRCRSGQQQVTAVTSRDASSIDRVCPASYIAKRRQLVKDIYEVLRKKQAQQAHLGKQIEALQTAAEELRNVAHLLDGDDDDRESAGDRG